MKLLSFIFYIIFYLANVVLSKSISSVNTNEEDGSLQYFDTENTGEKLSKNVNEVDAASKVEYHDSKKRSEMFDSIGKQPNARTCGIMYRNQEPIGILQPFEDSYKLIPLKQQKVDMNIDANVVKPTPETVYPRKAPDYGEAEETDESLPANKMENSPKKKRGASKLDKSGENASVEDKLKDILDDMGLIDDDLENAKKEEKRWIREDENMEEGLNNINMVKEKEEDEAIKENKRRSENSILSQFPMESPNLTENDVVTFTKNQGGADRNGVSSEKVPIRKRSPLSRSGQINAERKLNFLLDSVRWKAKAMYGTTADTDNEEGRKKRENENKKMKEPNADINDYEERVQRRIQSKIKALKEEVKREIASLQEEKAKYPSNDLTRTKRENAVVNTRSNTLLDAESSELDPTLNIDQNLKPYIRRRRAVTEGVENGSASNVTSTTKSDGSTTGKFQYSTNDMNVGVTSENSRNIRIIINATESTPRADKRQVLNTLIDFEKLKLKINDPLLNKNFDRLNFQDPNFDQVAAPSMKNEIIVNDGLPNYLYRRSCDSGHCGRNKAGEICDCGTTGCSCPGDNSSNSQKQSGLVDDDKDGNDISKEEKRSDFMAERDDNEYEFENNYENYDSNLYQRGGAIKRDKKAEYYIDLHPSVYHIARFKPVRMNVDEDEDYLEMPSRKKRNYNDDLVALHGGTASRNHMDSIKSQSNTHARVRRRTNGDSNDEPIQLIDLSEEDLFGALPQSFEGELGRYKRVKK